MPTHPTILDALRSPRLFGGLSVYRDLRTWGPWLTVLAAFYGLPLTEPEQQWFCQHTGRSSYSPPSGGWRELVVIVGRQSGKTRIASLVASFESAFGGDVEPGAGELYCLLVAQDHRASLRAIFSYARSPFEHVPVLTAMAPDPKAESIELTNGVTLAAYPCSPAAVRGIRCRVAVCDELGWFRSSEGLSQDQEMLRAIRPTLAMQGPGRLVILSSPAGQSGALYDLYQNHYGRDDSPVLIVQASAPELNPTLPADYLDRMRLDDPEGYRSEVLGEFRAGLTALFDPAAVRAAVDRGRVETAPTDGTRYFAWVDQSGGRRDAFAVGIGHREGDLIVVDVVRRWTSPFSPSAVVAECAALLARYRVNVVTGDRYGAEFVVELFERHRITFEEPPCNASALYLDLLNPVNSGQIRLPDLPDLLTELIGLERRKGTGGAHDRVVHPPGRHDDMANALAGVAYLLRGKTKARMLEGFQYSGPSRYETAAQTTSTGAVKELVRRVNGADVLFRVHPDGREVMDRVVEPVVTVHNGFRPCERCGLDYLDTGIGHACPRPWNPDDLRRHARPA